jgi:hypothetical protein
MLVISSCSVKLNIWLPVLCCVIVTVRTRCCKTRSFSCFVFHQNHCNVSRHANNSGGIKQIPKAAVPCIAILNTNDHLENFYEDKVNAPTKDHFPRISPNLFFDQSDTHKVQKVHSSEKVANPANFAPFVIQNSLDKLAVKNFAVTQRA